MLECTGLDGQNGAVQNGLMNTQRFVKEALGNQCTFFALIIRSHYYTQSEAVIWTLAGVGWGLPHPELLDGSVHFVGSQGQEETAHGHSEHQ